MMWSIGIAFTMEEEPMFRGEIDESNTLSIHWY